MKKLLSLVVFIAIFMLPVKKAHSQVSAVKINAPAFVLGMINAELETAISPSFSMNIVGAVYPFGKLPFVDKPFLNVTIQPGFRYWFLGLYVGPFIGAQITATALSAGSIKGSDYRAIAGGLGLSAGYAFMLAPRWNLELELGLSAFYIRYDKRPTGGAYDARLGSSAWLPFPSKCQVNLVYLF